MPTERSVYAQALLDNLRREYGGKMVTDKLLAEAYEAAAVAALNWNDRYPCDTTYYAYGIGMCPRSPRHQVVPGLLQYG